MSLERTILLGFGLGLLAVLITGFLSLNATFGLIESGRWVSRTQEVRAELESTISALKDAEASTLAFVITGDEGFLAPHQEAVRGVDTLIHRLQRLARDNPKQAERLEVLDSLVAEEFAYQAQIIDARRSSGVTVARGLMGDSYPGPLAKAMRLTVNVLAEEESVLLRAREQALATRVRSTISTISILIGLTLVFLPVFLFIARRELASRRQAERELQRTQTLLDSIIENIPAMIFLKDAGSLRFVRGNRAMEEMTGYSRSETLGKSDYDFFPKEEADAFTADDRKVLQKGEILDIPEEPLHPRVGPVRMLHTRKIAIQGNDGRPLYLLGISVDVTEQREREEAEKRAAREIEDLYNRAPCGYHSLDGNGRFVSINDTELSWLGYGREEVVGRMSFRDVITPASLPAFEASFQRFKERGVMHDQEFEMRRNDGSTFLALLNATAIRDAAGVFISDRTTLFDITERKKAEQEIQRLNEHLEQRAFELERAVHELESFSYSVSHDLRAPLRHISGFAGLLDRHLSGALDNEGRRFLNEISDSARRMATLIDELLAFSRMGRAEIQHAEVDVAALVRESLLSLDQDCAGRSIEWVVDAFPRVQGDPSMLRLALGNLISNAVKFTRTRSKARIEIGFFPRENEEVFFVRDNGVGFDMRYADKLFGVFQRLHGAAEFEGTGVGLAIVRRIIQRHGGETWAEAEVDKGATVYFSLPRLHSS